MPASPYWSRHEFHHPGTHRWYTVAAVISSPEHHLSQCDDCGLVREIDPLPDDEYDHVEFRFYALTQDGKTQCIHRSLLPWPTAFRTIRAADRRSHKFLERDRGRRSDSGLTPRPTRT